VSDPEIGEDRADASGPRRVADEEEDERVARRPLPPSPADPVGAIGPRDLGLDLDIPTAEVPPGPTGPRPIDRPGEIGRSGDHEGRRDLAETGVGERGVEPALPDDLEPAPVAREDPERPDEEPPVLGAVSGGRTVTVPLDDRDEGAAAVVALDDLSPFDAVVAVDDAGTVVAAEAARRLGLPHNPPDAVAAARHKLLMRRRLAAAAEHGRRSLLGLG